MMTKLPRPAIRTPRGWAICLLHDAGAIRECDTMAGYKTEPIPTRANVQSAWLDTLPRRPSLSGCRGGGRGTGNLGLYRRHLPECPPD